MQLATVGLIVIAAALTSACADEPRIWFENQRDETVWVAIDGDRLMIIKPHEGQFMLYSTAAWAWPRRIEIRIEHGPALATETLDAGELARRDFTYYIR